MGEGEGERYRGRVTFRCNTSKDERRPHVPYRSDLQNISLNFSYGTLIIVFFLEFSPILSPKEKLKKNFKKNILIKATAMKMVQW